MDQYCPLVCVWEPMGLLIHCLIVLDCGDSVQASMVWFFSMFFAVVHSGDCYWEGSPGRDTEDTEV